MKETGITKRIDTIGRILIPKELRRVYQIDYGAMVEFYVNQDDLYLKKYDMTDDVMKQIEQEKMTSRELMEYLQQVRGRLEQLQKYT